MNEEDNLPITTNTINSLIADAHDDSAIKDFDQARANISAMITTAKETIDILAEVAQQGQQPRHFEVLAKMIDTSVNASKTLLDIQEKIRNIKNIESPINKKAQTINNNLIVASTAELQKMLKGIKEENNE